MEFFFLWLYAWLGAHQTDETTRLRKARLAELTEEAVEGPFDSARCAELESELKTWAPAATEQQHAHMVRYARTLAKAALSAERAPEHRAALANLAAVIAPAPPTPDWSGVPAAAKFAVDRAAMTEDEQIIGLAELTAKSVLRSTRRSSLWRARRS
ncbi:hypothetical protein NE236_40365 [Actinoallomurus purpureus]|uniref:hypothetical protein n=1 Tax=Actinoallomurus purpureus TaxID=478114 RepID=UPI002093C44F|nr:hypothetical protein [Actinoallomurus purpureus]MCO6011223.1 hypothetical protein [Actinoallomurus purpureus]